MKLVWWIWENQSMYNHNKAQQSKNRVHISWDILYMLLAIWEWYVRMVYAKITIRLGKICSWKSMYLLSRMFMNIIFTAWIDIVSNYYRLSICRGYIWYDNAHSTAIKMIKLRSNFHSRTTPHTPPLRASYGVSFVSYTKNNDRDISIVHCISLRLSSQLYQHWY